MAKALDAAWRTFLKAAGDDLAGCDTAAASAEVRQISTLRPAGPWPLPLPGPVPAGLGRAALVVAVLVRDPGGSLPSS